MSDDTVTQNFVIFYSPGTFVAETAQHPIPLWDTDHAMTLADEVHERYGATPYGFCFTTRTRGIGELDSKETARSPMYFLGGKVETVEDVERRADPKETILLTNMKSNGYDRIVVNTNSWKWTQPLGQKDVVLDYTPPEKPSP